MPTCATHVPVALLLENSATTSESPIFQCAVAWYVQALQLEVKRFVTTGVHFS